MSVRGNLMHRLCLPGNQCKRLRQKSKTKAKAPAAKVHKIKNGESLSSISKKYGVSIAELKRANGMTNDKLRAGKTLKIPAKSKDGVKEIN